MRGSAPEAYAMSRGSRLALAQRCVLARHGLVCERPARLTAPTRDPGGEWWRMKSWCGGSG